MELLEKGLMDVPVGRDRASFQAVSALASTHEQSPIIAQMEAALIERTPQCGKSRSGGTCSGNLGGDLGCKVIRLFLDAFAHDI